MNPHRRARPTNPITPPRARGPAGLAAVLALAALAACTGHDVDGANHSVFAQEPSADAVTLGVDADVAPGAAADASGTQGSGPDAATREDATADKGDDAVAVADDAAKGEGATEDADAGTGDADAGADPTEDAGAATDAGGGADADAGSDQEIEDAPGSGDDTRSDADPIGGDGDVDDDDAEPAPTGFDVDWCRLWHPATYTADAGLTREVSAHVDVPGQTDLTSHGADPAWWLLAEVGYGPPGAHPVHDPEAFTWASMHPDADPPTFTFHAHDRYLADLAIPSPGMWDYAARFSVDAGETWRYCDLDGSHNGYDVTKSGRAEIR